MAKRSAGDEYGMPSLALVFGYIAIKELQRVDDRIAVLDRLGYGSSEIAKICDTTPASIRARRSQLKKKRRQRGLL